MQLIPPPFALCGAISGCNTYLLCVCVVIITQIGSKSGDVILGPKMGQFGLKWDKSITFLKSDFSSETKSTEIWSEKVPDLPHLGPIANLNPSESGHSVLESSTGAFQGAKPILLSWQRCQSFDRSGSDWHRMGTNLRLILDQISEYQILQYPRFVPFGANLTHFWPRSDTPVDRWGYITLVHLAY